MQLAIPVEQPIDFSANLLAVGHDVFAHRAGGADEGFQFNRWQSLDFRLQFGGTRAAEQGVEDLLR